MLTDIMRRIAGPPDVDATAKRREFTFNTRHEGLANEVMARIDAERRTGVSFEIWHIAQAIADAEKRGQA